MVATPRVSATPAAQPTHDAFRLARRLSWASGLTALCATALLSACAPGQNLPVLTATRADIYRLGVDDQIRVITYGEDQLSEDYRIDNSGNIAVPLLGSVHAAGLSTRQLGDEISADLESKKLLRNPSVSIEVTAYRPIFVLGEVVKPGQYPYQPNMTMLTAVASAGGFTYRAIQGYAYVIRQGTDRAEEGRLQPQGYVVPGDVIKIYERTF